MAEIKFHDYTVKVQKAIDEVAMSALEEAAGELESQVKHNTKVDTGQTKNSWTHNVKSSKGLYTATVGSPLQNAIWEEFGTGENALNGNGRLGGWSYKDEEGHWHHTYGKKARRPFWKAYSSLKNQLIKIIQDRVKGALK